MSENFVFFENRTLFLCNLTYLHHKPILNVRTFALHCEDSDDSGHIRAVANESFNIAHMGSKAAILKSARALQPLVAVETRTDASFKTCSVFQVVHNVVKQVFAQRLDELRTEFSTSTVLFISMTFIVLLSNNIVWLVDVPANRVEKEIELERGKFTLLVTAQNSRNRLILLSCHDDLVKLVLHVDENGRPHVHLSDSFRYLNRYFKNIRALHATFCLNTPEKERQVYSASTSRCIFATEKGQVLCFVNDKLLRCKPLETTSIQSISEFVNSAGYSIVVADCCPKEVMLLDGESFQVFVLIIV